MSRLLFVPVRENACGGAVPQVEVRPQPEAGEKGETTCKGAVAFVRGPAPGFPGKGKAGAAAPAGTTAAFTKGRTHFQGSQATATFIHIKGGLQREVYNEDYD